MFCPSCGLENNPANQFCRACGVDLRPVRAAIEKADAVTDSASRARDEVGRAVAQKIREYSSSRDLVRVAEDVLPQIQKFLESPEEKRMRRLRAGTIVASVGAGIALAFLLAAWIFNGVFALAAIPGVILGFIGLGLVTNGLLFTVPKKTLADNSDDADRQRRLDAQPTNELTMPETGAPREFTSVTEPTTRHLKTD